jgi:hypothetical protein
LIARTTRHKNASPSTENVKNKTQTNAQKGTQTGTQTNPQMTTPPPAPAPPAKIVITVESVPSGAEVRRGDELLGRTPLKLPVDAAHSQSLTLGAAGYAPLALDVDASLTQRYTVQLSPLAPPPQPPPKHASRHHHKSTAPTAPTRPRDEIKNGDTVDPFE